METTTSPRFPAYDPELGELDDFGPEPDPSTYRATEAERLAEIGEDARSEAAGRRRIAAAHEAAGCATTLDREILAEVPAAEVNADGSSVALFGADCTTCGAARCMGRLNCGCDDDEMATGLDTSPLTGEAKAEFDRWLASA